MQPRNGNLTRSLGLFPSMMIVITSIIGSGIFTVPGTIMSIAQGSGTNLLAWIIAGVACLLMAMVYTELAPAMPKAGGPYTYLTESYGEKVAFGWGWMTMISQVSTLALLALVFANYFSFFIHLSVVQGKIIASCVLLVGAIVNVRGVKFGAIINNGFSLAKLIALGLVVVGGLFTLKLTNFHPIISTHLGWSSAFSAAVPAIFAFGGYEQLSFMSEEVENPGKNIPRAILIGMVIVIIVNILISIVCMGNLSVTGLAKTDSAVATTALHIFGPIGGIVVGIGALISIFGTVNGGFMSMPRVVFSMSRDGVFPTFFSKLHSKYQTPYFSISIYCILAIALLWSGSFTMLLLMSTFTGRLMEALIATSLMALRKKKPDMHRPLKMWGYPFTFIIVVLLTLYLAFLVPPHEIMLGVILGLTSIPAYIIFYFIKRTQQKKLLK